MKKLSDPHLRILEKDCVSCDDVTKILDDYVEDGLPPSLRHRVMLHIHSCSECQDLEQGYRDVIVMAREIGREEPRISRDVQNRLRSELSRRLGIQMAPIE